MTKCKKSIKCDPRKYKTFNYPDSVPGGKTLLTGIRGVECKPKRVYISGFYEPAASEPDQQVKSFVYKGSCRDGTWHELYYPDSSVTNLYGPNNGRRKKNIQVVGNYVPSNSTNNLPVGCLYQGKLDGSGKWTSLSPTFPCEDDEVLGVIAHSTMGGLVVGNYDTQIDENKAFIYDIKTKCYHKIENKNDISITAYGIWHNECDSYTICGGYKSIGFGSFEKAYLVDWDNNTHKLSNWRSYVYDNDLKSEITHFNGITGDRNYGYNLVGDWVGIENPGLGFFASVKRDKCTGKFKKAKWGPIKFPLENSITSANSVYKDNVIGVYTTELGVNGFISKVKNHKYK